jgi:hypothetical protein
LPSSSILKTRSSSNGTPRIADETCSEPALKLHWEREVGIPHESYKVL